MEQQNLLPPIFLTYPDVKDSVNIILRNIKKPSEWQKVLHYLENKKGFISNEDVRQVIGNDDTVKVSKMLNKWVSQGLLVKVDTGSKRDVKYCLPDNKILDFLFT